ncbi:MAG TPA: hypothetical protein VF392_01915 [Terracidiphilus sp.]
MKRFFGYALIVAMLAIPAFAAKNSKKVTLTADVKVGSTELKAGDYVVTWTGDGKDVQVTIAQKRGATVTVPATVVEAKNDHVGALIVTLNGSNTLKTILLDDRNLVLAEAK